jgi:hypothetical protein
VTRGGWRLALLLAGGLLMTGRPLAGQAPAPEPVLLELELGRIAQRTVPAYRAGDQALIPLGAFCDLAEIRVNRRPDGVVEAILQPGNVPFVLDPASRTLRLGRERKPLGADQLVVTPGEVFLATGILADALNLEWAVSWPDLVAAVIEPENLPLARRIRREAFLHSRLAQSTAPSTPGLRLGTERAGVDGMVFDYSVLTATSSPVDGGAYSTALGLDVLGGSFGAALASRDGAGRPPRADVSWTGIWRESPYLAQLRLGDGFSTGPRGRSLRGVSLTNSPYVRPSILGEIGFGGQLGPGWTVEAYRGGRLVGFDSVNALGQFSLDLPVQYGENPVDFVAYGPFGEVREFNRTYRVRTDGLPARRLEYGLSAGECRTGRCRATGNLDLRYGVSTRWTLRAGLDQFWRDSLGNLTHPYLGMAGAVGNALSLEGEAVGNAVLHGLARYEPSVDVQLQLEGNHFARGVRDPILTPDGRRSQWTLSAFLRPSSRLGGTYLEGSLDRITARGGDLTSGRLGLSLQAADIRIIPAVRFQRGAGAGVTRSQTFFGFNTFVLPHPELGPVLGRLTARTTLELQQGEGAASGSAYLGLPILRGLRSEAGVSWFRGAGAVFSLLVAAELPTVRSYTTVTAGAGREALGSQYVQGSAIYNPARGSVDFAANPALERGGVTGRVFLDRNGNGRRDAGEPPVPGVRVLVGSGYATTDSSGIYHLWDLLAFDPVGVAVDSASLPSPLWVPAFALASVEVSPNRYRTLDIPLLPGGVVEGRVAWAAESAEASAPTDDAARPVAGVTLVLRHLKTGQRQVITTFSDGGFYAMGIRPGEWELSVDPKCLSLIGAQAAPARFTMAADPDGGSVSGLEVRLLQK